MYPLVIWLVLAHVAFCAVLPDTRQSFSTNFSHISVNSIDRSEHINEFGNVMFKDNGVVSDVLRERVKRDVLNDGRTCSQGTFKFKNRCWDCNERNKPLLKRSNDKNACT